MYGMMGEIRQVQRILEQFKSSNPDLVVGVVAVSRDFAIMLNPGRPHLSSADYGPHGARRSCRRSENARGNEVRDKRFVYFYCCFTLAFANFRTAGVTYGRRLYGDLLRLAADHGSTELAIIVRCASTTSFMCSEPGRRCN